MAKIAMLSCKNGHIVGFFVLNYIELQCFYTKTFMPELSYSCEKLSRCLAKTLTVV